MRFLILGGCGFIGRHLYECAIGRGHDCVVADIVSPQNGFAAPFRLLDILQVAPDDFRGFDRIYHVAGLLGTAETFEYPQKVVEVNVVGTLKVLEAARTAGVPMSYVTLGNDWLNPYSISKNAAADFCRMYATTYSMHIQIVVTYNLYGPYQKLRPIRKIVPYFLHQLKNGLPVEIYGDGRQIVDLVYAPDFASELLSTEAPGTVHIGSGVPISVNEVVQECARVLGVEKYEVSYVPSRMGEPTQSESLCPHGFCTIQPTPLAEGLRVTAEGIG
jgi:UDP-glucose 4-epimerase